MYTRYLSEVSYFDYYCITEVWVGWDAIFLSKFYRKNLIRVTNCSRD